MIRWPAEVIDNSQRCLTVYIDHSRLNEGYAELPVFATLPEGLESCVSKTLFIMEIHITRSFITD
jgi:hypothetical protein